MSWRAFVFGVWGAMAAFAADTVRVDPADGRLESYSSLTVMFDRDIVSPDWIDAEKAVSPIGAQPELNAKFIWRTQAQGEWLLDGPRIPGETYQFTLRPGLVDAAGKPVEAPGWAATFTTEPLSVDGYYGFRDNLSAQPQVPLAFNYPINLTSVTTGVWVQDRRTLQRFPVEVMLNRPTADAIEEAVAEVTLAELPASREFRVRPRQPLPVNGTYDLVVDGVTDAFGGRTLPYPRVFPLGRTRALAVDYVAARNWPTDRPKIEIKFTTPLAGATVPMGAIKVTPEVPGLHFRVVGETVFVEGNLDPKQRYRVEMTTAIRGDRGFALAAPSVWGATFTPKRAAILFPAGEIRQRSRLGLRFALVQVNTGALTWKLARVPAERLAEVVAQTERAPKNGEKLLIPQLGLEVAGQGEIPATDGDREELRKIEWRPDQGMLGGAYLLEASALDADGKTMANRSLIYFSEYALTQKSSPEKVWLRVADMKNGQPLAGVNVQLAAKDLVAIREAVTDANGVAVFDAGDLVGARYWLAQTPGAPTVFPLKPQTSFDSGSLRQERLPTYPGVIFTDRPLYRPGHQVKIKGMLRQRQGAELIIPEGQALRWEIERRGDLIASGKTTLNAEGGWDAEWDVPARGLLGEYRVSVFVDDAIAGNSANFQVEEYRNPPFLVACSGTENRYADSQIAVSSEYFHGAPNAGSLVRWTAEWITSATPDSYSEFAKEPIFSMEASGETALDGNGRATLTCPPPFTDLGNRTRAVVYWKVEVTGPDGQTIGNRFVQNIDLKPVTLGIRQESGSAGRLVFDLEARTYATDAVLPKKVKAQLFLVQTKSVKERLAPEIYRYRNTDEFIPKAEQNVPATGRLIFNVKSPGRYVVVISPLVADGSVQASEQAWVSAPGEAEVAVESDHSLRVEPKYIRVKQPDPQVVLVGEKARIRVESPSQGIAWVAVETADVLEMFTQAITGNLTEIEVPMKAEYEPNVYVSVYVLRPGGETELPGELFGSTRVQVVNPARNLKIQPSVERAVYEPRETVRGEVTVTANGQPVPNAELAVYVVDDSILELGEWNLPNFLSAFFPNRPHGVVTYLALQRLIDRIAPQSLTQKGFTVGGGGKDEFSPASFKRKEFKPLILWQPSLKTNAQGRVTFECEAPDNLTRFRVIALGQTRQNQFGAGDTTFEVSRDLLIEPALPRFLREGDEVELRAVARHKLAGTRRLKVTCQTGEGIQILGNPEIELEAASEVPAVVRFRAKVSTGVTEAPITFTVTLAEDATVQDSIEITLPVSTPNIRVAESVTGNWKGATFAAGESSRSEWKDATGQFSLTLSTSPWLPKLLGLPYVLNYPHGCFEQKSSRLLVYTSLTKLLDYLPASETQRANYERIIERSLQEFATSILPDKMLPFWPNGTEGNEYVTLQVAWSVMEAVNSGIEVPESLVEAVTEILAKVIARETKQSAPPTLRAFALFIASQFETENEEAFTAAVEELYLQRDKLSDEGRAWLALALNFSGQKPEWQQQLLREIPVTVPERSFDARTFASTTRSEAMALWAHLAIAPKTNSQELRTRLERLMESSESLSTQENLWLLMAFNALIASQPLVPIAPSAKPVADAISANGVSAAWSDRDLAKLAALSIRNLGKSAGGSFVMRAQRQLPFQEQAQVSEGMRLARVIKNLTDPTRTGTPEAPLQLGDEVLISYRIQTDKPQSYLALEDALPAGLEIVNPNLAMFARTFRIPDEPGLEKAYLSHSEMRDQQTNLYFDQLPAGTRGYSVLARATSAGTFAWPSSQISPMYDSRFQARTAPSLCVVVSK